MYVLVAASRKGGSGKSVTVRHIAVAALHGGIARVAAVDLDPMRGLTRWWSRRPADGLELVDLIPPEMPRETAEQRSAAALAAAEQLSAAIPSLRTQGFGLVVVDTPPAADQIVRLAIAAADLVLVPVRPSPDDLDAVGETADLVTIQGKPMVFVVNSATKRARLTSDAAIALSQHGTVSPAVLHRSDVYAASALDGLTVLEADPRGAPAGEVSELWGYVSKRLGIPPISQSVNKSASMLTRQHVVKPALHVVGHKVKE